MHYLIFYTGIATQAFVYIIINQSYNLILGYSGMVHVGHVAFMAIGAYASALFTLSGYSFLFGSFAGTVLAGVIGFLLAYPTVKVRDDYLVAATLGMGEIIRLALLNEREFTGGSTGLPKIPRPELFGFELNGAAELFLFHLVITTLVLFFIHKLIKSPFGKVVESIREDELASETLGHNTRRVKIQILVIGAMLAGFSGSLWAHLFQFIDPDVFNIHSMIFVFLTVVLGGSGTFWGPVVGTLILFALYEIIRTLPLQPQVLGALRWIVYSVILIIIMIFKPKGIMGEQLVRKKL